MLCPNPILPPLQLRLQAQQLKRAALLIPSLHAHPRQRKGTIAILDSDDLIGALIGGADGLGEMIRGVVARLEDEGALGFPAGFGKSVFGAGVAEMRKEMC
jgi:hypothetical protein